MSADSPSNLTSVSTPAGPGTPSDSADTKIVKPISYRLTCPLRYGGKDGRFEDAGFVMLYEPAGRNRDACSVLEDLFLRSLRENKKLQAETPVPPEEIEAALKMLKQRRDEVAIRGETDSAVADAKEETVEGFTGPEILQMIGSTSFSTGEVINGVRKLLCGTGLARVDDSVNLTPTMADEMPWRELKGLVGAYLAGFTVPSALDDM